MYDIAIIGAGPAGLTAALYGRRGGNTVAVLEGGVYGGQVATTPEVENFPGIISITGVDFSMGLYNQVEAQGAEILFEGVRQVELGGKVKRLITTQRTVEAKTVIIANGARRRKLGCPGEKEFSGRGVSYCATCDGAFFRGRNVAIVGGGNTELEDALFLSNNCEKVYLIHRRDAFRASKVLAQAIGRRENIQILWNSVVQRIDGDKAVEEVTLANTQQESCRSLPVAAVFVAIGLEPENSLYQGQLELDKAGYIIAGEDCKTNLPGVYAAGDTRTKGLRQIITAAADGAVAAFEAARHINELEESTQ